MSIPNSQFIPRPFSSLDVHTLVLYFCVLISALQIKSSVSFFLDSTYMYNIGQLFFSSVLHSV